MAQLNQKQQRHDVYDGERARGVNPPVLPPTEASSGSISTVAAIVNSAAARFEYGAGAALNLEHGIERAMELENGRLATSLADDPLTRGTILWLSYAVLAAILLVVLFVVATLA